MTACKYATHESGYFASMSESPRCTREGRGGCAICCLACNARSARPSDEPGVKITGCEHPWRCDGPDKAVTL